MPRCSKGFFNKNLCRKLLNFGVWKRRFSLIHQHCATSHAHGPNVKRWPLGIWHCIFQRLLPFEDWNLLKLRNPKSSSNGPFLLVAIIATVHVRCTGNRSFRTMVRLVVSSFKYWVLLSIITFKMIIPFNIPYKLFVLSCFHHNSSFLEMFRRTHIFSTVISHGSITSTRRAWMFFGGLRLFALRHVWTPRACLGPRNALFVEPYRGDATWYQ